MPTWQRQASKTLVKGATPPVGHSQGFARFVELARAVAMASQTSSTAVMGLWAFRGWVRCAQLRAASTVRQACTARLWQQPHRLPVNFALPESMPTEQATPSAGIVQVTLFRPSGATNVLTASVILDTAGPMVAHAQPAL